MGEYAERRPLFGKEVEIAVYGIEPLLAKHVIDKTYAEGVRLQGIFNFYSEASELSRLNQQRTLQVSPELWTVIRESLEYCRLTDGAYDIALGALTMKRKKGLPLPQRTYSYKDIAIRGNVVTLRMPGMLLDLGSVAKGYIVDRMVAQLQSLGVLSGLVDGRGDMRAFGEQEHEIGIQHPRDPKKSMGTVRMRNLSIATSGDYQQYVGDYDHSHIIGKQDIISATVIAPELYLADILATALCVVDDKARKTLLAAKGSTAAMTIDTNMRIEYHNGFERLLV